MSDTQDIKDKIDVVDFIGEYVQLKPAGTNHKGLCPFHSENSPSFMVSRERQRFHCFGCGKDGDIFTFLQEIEGMDFVESLKFLADRAGVTLEQRISSGDQSQQHRIKDINKAAAVFYHKFLQEIEQAAPARTYLKERGLLPDTITAWQIGYVPDQWDLLTKYLLKKGFAIDDLVASGLTIKRDTADRSTGRGYYDRFRGRIMFPIRDVHGGVAGFTGRVLVETEKSGGKYVNTPQTPVFDKSRLVFGLDLAKQAIRKKDRVVLVEGQMDVISVWQSGMEEVVATSGTAMTEQQISLLKRYSNNIAMAFDGDAAGIKAAKRGIDIAIAAGMHVKIISLSAEQGSDPDDCVKKDPAVWRAAVEQAQDVMPWLFDQVFSGNTRTTPQEKQEAVDTLLPDIARIPYAVERDHWLRELATRVGVTVAVLQDDMARLSGNDRPRRDNQPEGETDIEPKKKVPQTRLVQLQQRWVLLLVKFPSLFRTVETDPQVIVQSAYGPLYEEIKKVYTENTPEASRSEQFQRAAMRADHELDGFSLEDAQTEFVTVTHALQEEWRKSQRARLLQELAQKEQAGDTVAVTALLTELQQFM